MLFNSFIFTKYLSLRNSISQINGERGIDEIFADVVAAIDELLASKSKAVAAN